MNLQENIKRILREETSLKETVRDMVKTQGFKMAANIIGSLDEVHKILDLKSTQEDMVFIVRTILKHDLDEPMCSFNVSEYSYSIRTLVNIPLPNPNNIDAWINRISEIELDNKIRNIVYELGKGIVYGNDIKVSAVWCKLK